MMKPKTTESAPQSGAAQPWTVVGLAPAESMPIDFAGRRYDLANLTPEEATYLLQFPEQVPYLQLLDTPNQAQQH